MAPKLTGIISPSHKQNLALYLYLAKNSIYNSFYSNRLNDKLITSSSSSSSTDTHKFIDSKTKLKCPHSNHKQKQHIREHNIPNMLNIFFGTIIFCCYSHNTSTLSHNENQTKLQTQTHLSVSVSVLLGAPFGVDSRRACFCIFLW